MSNEEWAMKKIQDFLGKRGYGYKQSSWKGTKKFAFKDIGFEAILGHLNKNSQLVVEDKRLDCE